MTILCIDHLIGAFRVILDDCVSTEEGTGLVHCAPAFGEVDFYAANEKELNSYAQSIKMENLQKKFLNIKGIFVKDADKDIIKRLSRREVIHHGQMRHRYPFCWRSDTPLIYKAVRTWFVAVEKIKDQDC